MKGDAILEVTNQGLYCPAAELWIDPVRRVPRRVVTHGHSDHARPGPGEVLTSLPGQPLVQARVGNKAQVRGIPFREPIRVGHAWISLHPAGHVLGSAQVRIEVAGRVAVVTGDYKRGNDPTCEPFEPVSCDLLVTETTFGLPVYRWPAPAVVAAEVDAWWDRNQREGVTSLLLGYSLGKAQRLLGLLNRNRGPIHVHGAVKPFVTAYRKAGIDLPDVEALNAARLRDLPGTGALVVAPPSAAQPAWMRKLGPCRVAFASGWVQVRRHRGRGGGGTGFVLSDHVDWPELVQTVADCRPTELWATHGFREAVARYFAEQGLRTRVV